MTPPDYEYLRKLLKDHSGLDLSADKQYLIESRLLPLSRKCGLAGISELVQKMKGGAPAIIAQVVEAMTTNETFFFRDKVPFDHFRDSIVPEVLKARAARKSIRIWCAAGSTGQEPYSLAMSRREQGSRAGHVQPGLRRLHHGDRRDLAPGLPAQLDLRYRGHVDRGGLHSRSQPQGVLSAAVIDRARLSPLRIGPRQRHGHGHSLPARQERQEAAGRSVEVR
ncbi:hypothetical protein JQ575_33615 [Bradyrhizobium sp. JYMT SZCCT0428]|nr:hypothetical protein [Bradyrhizobium sp. JYMT SZCCT0428]